MTTKVIVAVEYLHPGSKVVVALANPESGAVFPETVKEITEANQLTTVNIHSHADLVVKEVPIATE